MTMKRDYWFGAAFLLIVAIFIFLAVSRVGAQGATPLPTGSTPVELPDAANLLWNDLAGIISSYAAITAATATVIIGFLKYVPFLDGVSAPLLNLVVNGLLVVGYWLAGYFGILDTYQRGLYEVKNVGELVLALIVSVLGSSFFHNQAVKGNIPVAGMKRTA